MPSNFGVAPAGSSAAKNRAENRRGSIDGVTHYAHGTSAAASTTTPASS